MLAEEIMQKMEEEGECMKRMMQHAHQATVLHTQTSWKQVKLPALLFTYHHGMKNPVLYFIIEVGLKITSIGAHILPGSKNANYQGTLGRKNTLLLKWV